MLKSFRFYYLNLKQEEVLKKYVKENLKLGFIKESQSPVGYLVLFIPKKGTDKL